MNNKYKKLAINLSILIGFISLLISVCGLIMDNLYRDNSFVTSAWIANDFVTLVIAVPILVFSLISVSKDKKVGYLLWIGLLDYMIYNYAFYLFAAAFNWFFILYVILFVLSVAVLIMIFIHMDITVFSNNTTLPKTHKVVSIYLFFVAFMLSMIYSIQIFDFINNDRLPSIITLTGHPTNVVFALDLSLVVPVFIFAAILLWKSKTWGVILGGMGLVKGIIYNLVLVAGTYNISKNGYPEIIGQIFIWIFLFITALLFFIILSISVPKE